MLAKKSNMSKASKFYLHLFLYFGVLFNIFSCNLYLSDDKFDLKKNKISKSDDDNDGDKLSLLERLKSHSSASSNDVEGDQDDNDTKRQNNRIEYLLKLKYLIGEYLNLNDNADNDINGVLFAKNDKIENKLYYDRYDDDGDGDDVDAAYLAKNKRNSLVIDEHNTNNRKLTLEEYENLLRNMKNVQNKKHYLKQLRIVQMKLQQLRQQIADLDEYEKYQNLQRTIFSHGRKR